MQLFDSVPRRRCLGLPDDAYETARRAYGLVNVRDVFSPNVDERMLDVYARARNPTDPFELRDLWLGRVEHELGPHSRRPALAEQWCATKVHRTVEPAGVLSSRATVRFVKELFNWFFRDDVYGELRDDTHLILSSGSVDEEAWGLPETLKRCIRFALERDWYGYSDSRGRLPARQAIAEYENTRIESGAYETRNVALTMGGTFAISALADFVLLGTTHPGAPVLCGIPNYPPLVEAIARRCAIRLVPMPSRSGYASVDGLIAALTPATPMVMLQTAANPTGAAPSEANLARLIRSASPSTIILLDECHEWLGPPGQRSPARAAPNVVRVSSLSKTWSVPGLKLGWVLADAAFIDRYYEYASTTFGGPQSFLYTAVEVLARMERWLITDLDEVGRSELAEFEPSYNLDLTGLQDAYHVYRLDRQAREAELTVLRDAALAGFADASASVVCPRFSINIAVDFPGWGDSYLCFRDILRRTGVSVFPGILTFCLSGGTVRITTARQWTDLSTAISRLRSEFALSEEG